jgi:mannose-6-phosphate isomerase-like protein (cupin superfamily)
MSKVNLAEKLTAVTEHWRPKIVAELNGQEVKVVKVKGEFVWHHHEHEDEMFLVLKGALRIDFRDRSVELGPGELVVVPKGVEHRPAAEEEVELQLFEPANLLNTGNVEHPELTAPKGVRL